MTKKEMDKLKKMVEILHEVELAVPKELRDAYGEGYASYPVGHILSIISAWFKTHSDQLKALKRPLPVRESGLNQREHSAFLKSLRDARYRMRRARARLR